MRLRCACTESTNRVPYAWIQNVYMKIISKSFSIFAHGRLVVLRSVTLTSTKKASIILYFFFLCDKPLTKSKFVTRKWKSKKKFNHNIRIWWWLLWSSKKNNEKNEKNEKNIKWTNESSVYSVIANSTNRAFTHYHDEKYVNVEAVKCKWKKKYILHSLQFGA